MGTVLFRLTLLACGVLAATAGPAFANATVEFIPQAVDHDSEVRVIGDAYAPRRAMVAVLEGHAAGREI